MEGRKRGSLASLFPDAATVSSGGGGGSKRESYASSSEGVGGVGGHVGYPIVTIEEATVDGHGCVDDDDEEEDEDRMLVDGDGEEEDGMDVDGEEDSNADVREGGNVPATTPVKQQKTRTRPVSEQLLRGRPKAVYEDDEGSFFLFLFSFPSFLHFYFSRFVALLLFSRCPFLPLSLYV